MANTECPAITKNSCKRIFEESWLPTTHHIIMDGGVRAVVGWWWVVGGVETSFKILQAKLKVLV